MLSNFQLGLSHFGLHAYIALNPPGKPGCGASLVNALGLGWLRDLPLVLYSPHNPGLTPRAPWGLDPTGLDLTGLREVGLTEEDLRALGTLIVRKVDPATLEELLQATTRGRGGWGWLERLGPCKNHGTLSSLRAALGEMDPIALLDLREVLQAADSAVTTRVLVGLEGVGDSVWYPHEVWYPQEALQDGLDDFEKATWVATAALPGYLMLALTLIALWVALRHWAHRHVIPHEGRPIGPLEEWEEDSIPAHMEEYY